MDYDPKRKHAPAAVEARSPESPGLPNEPQFAFPYKSLGKVSAGSGSGGRSNAVPAAALASVSIGPAATAVATSSSPSTASGVPPSGQPFPSLTVSTVEQPARGRKAKLFSPPGYIDSSPSPEVARRLAPSFVDGDAVNSGDDVGDGDDALLTATKPLLGPGSGVVDTAGLVVDSPSLDTLGSGGSADISAQDSVTSGVFGDSSVEDAGLPLLAPRSKPHGVPALPLQALPHAAGGSTGAPVVTTAAAVVPAARKSVLPSVDAIVGFNSDDEPDVPDDFDMISRLVVEARERATRVRVRAGVLVDDAPVSAASPVAGPSPIGVGGSSGDAKTTAPTDAVGRRRVGASTGSGGGSTSAAKSVSLPGSRRGGAQTGGLAGSGTAGSSPASSGGAARSKGSDVTATSSAVAASPARSAAGAGAEGKGSPGTSERRTKGTKL